MALSYHRAARSFLFIQILAGNIILRHLRFFLTIFFSGFPFFPADPVGFMSFLLALFRGQRAACVPVGLFAPHTLGVLLMVACFSWVVDSLTPFLLPQYEDIISRWMSPLRNGELLFQRANFTSVRCTRR